MMNRLVVTSPQTPEYLLKAVTLVDVKQGKLSENVTIRIKNGQIAQIDDFEMMPANLPVYEGHHLFAMPGLIDLHVHLAWDGSKDPLTTMKNETIYMTMARGISNAQASLMQGITTLRDVGSPDDIGVDIGKVFSSGLLLGPTVIGAGRIIQPTGGHVPDIGWIADSKDELIKAVRSLKARGAEVIKVASTGGAYGPEEIGPSLYQLQDLEVIVQEATRLGLKVASHSLGKIGIENAVRAGISTIEHGANISNDILSLMKEKGTYLVPTLAIYKKLSESTGEIADSYVEKSKTVVAWHRDTFQRAMEVGVPIALGTDAGSPNFGSHPSVLLEMQTMVDYGMKPFKVLQAATQNAAKALGKESVIGTVDVGKNADILLLEKNPLEKIENVSSIHKVIKNGVLL